MPDSLFSWYDNPDTKVKSSCLDCQQAKTRVWKPNYDGPTMVRAAGILEELRVPFVINQNRYSIMDRTIETNGLKSAAAGNGKGIIAFSPLDQGRLTDRYLNGIPADSRIRTDGRFLHESDITGEMIDRLSVG